MAVIMKRNLSVQRQYTSECQMLLKWEHICLLVSFQRPLLAATGNKILDESPPQASKIFLKSVRNSLLDWTKVFFVQYSISKSYYYIDI